MDQQLALESIVPPLSDQIGDTRRAAWQSERQHIGLTGAGALTARVSAETGLLPNESIRVHLRGRLGRLKRGHEPSVQRANILLEVGQDEPHLTVQGKSVRRADISERGGQLGVVLARRARSRVDGLLKTECRLV